MAVERGRKRAAGDEVGLEERGRGAYDSDLEYVQDELRWVEARARRLAVGQRLARGDDDEFLSRRGPRSMVESADTLRRRAREHERDEEALRRQVDARRAAHRMAGRPALALDRLVETWGLDDFERLVLLLAAAPCFSRRFDELYSEVDEHQMSSGLTVEVAFAFAELTFVERIRRRKAFGPKGRLAAADLVNVQLGGRFTGPKDLLTAELELTARTFAYLLGENDLEEELLDFSAVEEPRVTLDQVVLSPEDKRRILSVVERHEEYLACRKAWGFDDVIRYGRGVLMLFHGKPGTGKTMTAHAVADRLGKRVLNVDIPTFLDHADAARFLPGLFREARLQNALLFFDECEALFASRRMGNTLMTLLLSEIERFEGVAVLATNAPEELDEALDRRILVKVRFPEPDRHARREIWRKHLPEQAPLAADVDVELLADRYDLAGGYIKNAVLVAVADAVHGDGEAPVITMAALERAAMAQLQRPTDDPAALAHPCVRLADVALPADVRVLVQEIVTAARSRRTVLERWGVGAHLTYGKGVSALFHGGPGTGKTLCAEAVAGELNRPLLTAAIPAIVSKWVGETERNLVRLFGVAQAHGAVLFLDEADSLLTARGEGRASRHDDSAVNVLLQLVERHEGIVLLATNLPDRLDAALARRLTYRVRFPFPEAAERAAIWRRLLPATVPTTGDIDLGRLAARYALSGGHIKNAVFKAAFRAASADRPLTQAQLAEAAEEELAAAGDTRSHRRVGFARAEG